MATVVRLKKSTGTTAPTTLADGEIGYTQGTGTQANGGYRLFIGAGTESGGVADHTDIIGGKYFTEMLDHVHGTLTASSAVIVDSNSKIDNWNVDNININQNTISTTNSNGSLVLDPNGSGKINASNSRIINVTDPTQPQDAATKYYVDANSSGLDVKKSCELGTTAALATVTYDNGSSGVGATLTASANGALSVDSVAVAVDERILVKDQAAQLQNGIYTVTATGGASAVFVLTRADDFDTTTEVTPGAFTFVSKGTANPDNGYVMSTDGTIVIGTTAIVFDQFSGAGQIIAGDGLTKSGNTMSAVVDDSSITIISDAIQVKAVGVTNAMLAGSIANSKLSNSTVSYGGVSVALGASDATPAFNLSDATAYPGDTSLVTTGTIGTGTWQGTAVADTYVANDLTISGGTIDNSVIGGTTAAAITGTQVDITAQGDLRLQDTTGGQYVALQAPGTVSTSWTATLPAAVGSSGQALRTSDGSGTLEWFTPEVGDITGVTAGTGLSGGGSSGVVTLNVDAAQTQITSVGTIGTGTWQGTAVADTYVANDLTISGGTVNNSVIGGSTPAAATVTTLNATGATTLDGAVTIGNATADDITFTGLVASNFVPKTDDTYDLGSSTKRWNKLWLAAATIDLGGAEISSDGTGAITIAASGATLPSGSLVGSDAIATANAVTGTPIRNVDFFTNAGGISERATQFVFKGSGSEDVEFEDFYFSNGTNIMDEQTIALFVF